MTGHEFNENLQAAIATLNARKSRSFLTLLGVVIGVTSVIAVASIINGLNRYVQQRVEKLGSRTYFVSRIQFGPTSRPTEKIRKRRFFEPTYSQLLRERCPSLDVITMMGTRAAFFGDVNEIRYGAETVERIFVRGAEPEYIEALPIHEIIAGRFLSQFDLDHSRQVAVLGKGISDTLFGAADPIGKQVSLNGKPYEVIGVFGQDTGFFGGPGIDQFVVIPFTQYVKEYPNAKEFFIAVTVRKDVEFSQGIDELLDGMRRIRKLSYNAENDFEMTSPDFLSNLWQQLTGALVMLTGLVASVGLLVGGVGVMNIMLISVTERTQEIGVRKAIGARRNDIRVQFLLEAILLTVTGGFIGIGLGWLIAFAVRSLLPDVPATLSYEWVAIGVAISVGVGLFFGYYPANRAANLDPIVCLRYE